MEDYLMELFEQDGVSIFHTDYQLLLKLLNKYHKGRLRNDAYYINALLGGNALYKSIIEAYKRESREISRVEYNIFLSKMYNTDRFWRNENIEPEHLEYLLRMLYKVAGLNIAGIPMTMISNETDMPDKNTLMSELKLSMAEYEYEDKNYRAALEKSKILFEKGINPAEVLLSKAYFYGQGTHKDYNKALFYLTYPHKRSKQQDKDERTMLSHLLILRDKATYSAVICLLESVILFLFMLITGFFSKHPFFTLFNMAVLLVGSILFVIAYKKKFIFDFSYWFLILGCMFLEVLIL